jgi:hypothetical protein
LPARHGDIEWQWPDCGVAEDADVLRFGAGNRFALTSGCLAAMHNFAEDAHRFRAGHLGGSAGQQTVDHRRADDDENEHGGAHGVCPAHRVVGETRPIRWRFVVSECGIEAGTPGTTAPQPARAAATAGSAEPTRMMTDEAPAALDRAMAAFVARERVVRGADW